MVNKKAYSWPVIILLLIFFFPVGFYLLYKRFSVDKTSVLRNYKGLMNTGFICAVLGAIYLIMGATGQIKNDDGLAAYEAAIIMPIVFGIPAAIFIYGAVKTKREGFKFVKYLNAVTKQNQFIIDIIAANLGVSYDTAAEDLQKMIEYGYFPNAYIDYVNHKLILHSGNEADRLEHDSGAKAVTVKCLGCGANNTVFIGQTAECEYCGTRISE